MSFPFPNGFDYGFSLDDYEDVADAAFSAAANVEDAFLDGDADLFDLFDAIGA